MFVLDKLTRQYSIRRNI